jgi:uncharacterized protein YlzI (FlbEa/FlbD family)
MINGNKNIKIIAYETLEEAIKNIDEFFNQVHLI